MALFSVNGLSVSYGPITAVHAVDLAVVDGEIVALLGANGAGKSSLLKSCMGLAPRSAGSVSFDGQAISKLPTEAIVRLGLTMVPEGRRIFPSLTVDENLTLGTASASLSKSAIAERRQEAYDLFPRLAERRSQLAGSMSGGEQQMLAIGRALMSRPRMVFLDEPSLGLAPNIVDLIFDMIIALRDRACTVLVVEQNAELALDIVDRAYVIAGGRVVAAGTPEILRSSGILATAYLS